jgi:hypothetical protein
MGVRFSGDRPILGEHFTIRAASFTEDIEQALPYAEGADIPILLRIRGESHSFNLQAAYSPRADDLFPEISLQEAEWLSGGEFQIVGANVGPDGVLIVHIKQLAVPQS